MAPSPQQGASFLSLWLWHWMQPLINLANKRSLEMEDLYDLSVEETTSQSDYQWTKARENNMKASLWKVMVWFYGTKLLCYAIVARLVWLASGIFQVYAVKALVVAVKDSDIKWWKGLLIVFAALGFPLIQMLSQSYLSITCTRLGMQIRAAICAAVFRKVLVMKSVALTYTSHGQLLNIISNDMQKLMDFLNAFPFVALLLLDVFIITGLAIWEIGYSALPGIVIILLAQFFQIGLGRTIKSLRKRALEFIDARVRLVGDAVTGIRVIKYNGWVVPFLKQIEITRSLELKWIAKASIMRGLATAIGDGYVPLSSLATFGVYAALHRGNLDPTSTFTILPFLGVLYKSAGSARPGFLIFGEAMIAINRVQDFLKLSFPTSSQKPASMTSVKTTNCTFSWELTNKSPIKVPPVLRNISFEANKGELVAVVGCTGSGKSSLLLGLLGELKIVQGSCNMEQDAVYVPQQPWIINDTVRNNIVFGSTFDMEKYQSVLSACALDQDAAFFPSGSDSEIGERGINLSGGQKARISLARACYNTAATVLLDDPFSAVDVPTTKHLIQHVLGGVLKGRTVIIATHSEMCLAICDRVYRLEHGTLILSEAEKEISRVQTARKELEMDQPRDGVLLETFDSFNNLSPDAEEETSSQLHGQLVKKESMLSSRGLSTGDLKEYLTTMGWPLVVIVGVSFVITQCSLTAGDYWLSLWTDKKFNLKPNVYTAVYALLTIFFLASACIRVGLFTKATNDGARKLHRNMVEKVLRSPVSFFDHTPTGRILNRFSKDQSIVDEILPFSLQQVLAFVASCLGALALIAVLLPWFLIFTPLYFLAFMYLRQRYVAACCDLKRLDGISRSAVYTHLVESIEGVVSIRAYGAQQRFMDSFVELVDRNNQACMMYAHASRWFAVRMEMTVIFNLAMVSALVIALRNTISPGVAGVILVQSLKLSGLFQFTIRSTAEAENQFTSVERIQEYTHLESEPENDVKPDPGGALSNDWPQHGNIEFNNYTMAYRENLKPALHNISFKVHGGEKLGILGRTGSGKSSLVAAIFRMVQNSACSGSILIDNIDIQYVKLDDLRRRLSIIPQDPVLFRGALRFNLDPFSEHSDADMYEALKRVHLADKVKSLGNGLDSEVTENGGNFSLGERQLICLARTLLRKSRIVILDEATAAIDNKTDRLIQTTMRDVFKTCTCLTVAHRINTIIDSDRVLVLDKGGRIAELDSPINLLRADTVGVFATMVSQCGKAMAEELTRLAEDKEMSTLT